MSQNPVQTPLFVSRIVAGSGITVTPEGGTGIVTIENADDTDAFASPPPLGSVAPNTVAATTVTATHNSTFNTIQVGTLTATGLTVLNTTQIGGLTTTNLTATGQASFTTLQVGTLTATGLTTLASAAVSTLAVSALTATGNTSLVTTQVSTLTATGLASLSTTHIGGLTTLVGGLVATAGNAAFSTTQVGPLTVTQITSLTPSGTFNANGATPVTVANAAVTANSQILITLKTAGGTVAQPFVATITPSTGFTVNSAALNTSTYNYTIIG